MLARSFVPRLPSAATSTGLPPQLQRRYQGLAAVLARARADAPAAVSADFGTFAAAEDQILDAWAGAQYNFENLAPTTFQILSQPNVATAAGHVGDYMRQVCKIGTAP